MNFVVLGGEGRYSDGGFIVVGNSVGRFGEAPPRPYGNSYQHHVGATRWVALGGCNPPLRNQSLTGA
jgi:hypothetical protein